MTLRTALIAFCASGLLAYPQDLSAQSASEPKPHVPLEKSIGHAKPEVVYLPSSSSIRAVRA